jgi:hypothetical protein
MSHSRRGAAAIWTLLVIVLVTAMMAAGMARFATARRAVEAQVHEARCDWLARSGIEIAAAKMLADEKYAGETAKPFGTGELTIAVKKEKDAYRITAAAREGTAARTLERSFRRTSTPDGVRLEPVR